VDVISIVITVASVWKHPKSLYWTACFRDQNGRQRRISTKETDNKKALKIAEEFERGLLMRNPGRARHRERLYFAFTLTATQAFLSSLSQRNTG
jgi:hypothetical protein